jgi:hypothetical protein
MVLHWKPQCAFLRFDISSMACSQLVSGVTNCGASPEKQLSWSSNWYKTNALEACELSYQRVGVIRRSITRQTQQVTAGVTDVRKTSMAGPFSA